MKLPLIVVLVLILAGAGGYYYFFILSPRQYAEAVLELKQEFDEGGKVLFQSDIGGRFDYKGALDTVVKRRAFLEEASAKISKLSPPLFNTELREFRKDWLASVEGYQAANADAGARAKFLVGFSDIGFFIEPNPKPPLDEKTAYARDMQAFFEKTFGGLKAAMSEAAKAEESPKINDEAEFEKLKSMWAETGPALDIMLDFMRAQDSDAKPAGYSPKGFTTKQQYDASEKVIKFGDALKKVLESNTAYDILAYRFFEGLDEKVTKPAEQVRRDMEDLRTQYAGQ